MPQNDSSLQPATITRDISNYLKEGKITEAAAHSIAVLSVGVDDKVRLVNLKSQISTNDPRIPT